MEKMPALFFNFSRKDCQIKAKELAKLNLFKRDQELLAYMNKKLEEAPSEVSRLTSTMLLKETVQQGIAFHHAGLPPVIKEVVEDLFGMGKINLLYTTETFAVGINMPARPSSSTACGSMTGIISDTSTARNIFRSPEELVRRGIDTHGYAISMIFRPTF